jgi:N-acetylneuraminate synthase
VEKNVGYALFHCTSIYPTPYDKIRLGALADLGRHFPTAPIGLSDHSHGIYTCLGASALGAVLLEKHFTSDKTWPGPDIPISIDPTELRDLILGSRAIWQALGGDKAILPEEQPTINFAYACVVAIRDIKQGELFSLDNIWVKRPGTGEIKAVYFEKVVGKTCRLPVSANTQITWDCIGGK